MSLFSHTSWIKERAREIYAWPFTFALDGNTEVLLSIQARGTSSRKAATAGSYWVMENLGGSINSK